MAATETMSDVDDTAEPVTLFVASQPRQSAINGALTSGPLTAGVRGGGSGANRSAWMCWSELSASIHPVSVTCVLISELRLDAAAREVAGDQYSDGGQDPHRTEAMCDEENDS
jgi:hypothetical protein